jgi:branched-chain amino acid transport system permease protein
MALPVGLIFTIDLIASFAIYLIISLSLNLEYGYGGIPNFGKLFAVAGGAFVIGLLPGRIMAGLLGVGVGRDYIEYNRLIITEVNGVLQGNVALSLALLLTSLVVAGIFGAILGFISCYPAIRLREDYLAISLLAMGEAIRVIGHNYTPIIGGTLGVAVPDPFRWAGDFRYFTSSLFMLGIALLVLFYLEVLVRAPLGRVLRAIRDNERAAESLGKDATRIRMKTIMVASVIGAVGGALYAFHTGNVISLTYHRAAWTFWPWVMVILGGAGNNIGVMVGAFAFVALRKFIIFYKDILTPFVPFDVVWLDLLLLGVALILIQMYRPAGIIQEKPTSTLSPEKLEKIAHPSKPVSPSTKEKSSKKAQSSHS